MNRITALLTAALAAAALIALAVLPSAAQDSPPPIAVEELTSPAAGFARGEFTDPVAAKLRVRLDGKAATVLNMPDPSRVAVARITVQPGAQFPWHTHPGPVIVTVAQGELVYVNASDCVQRPYPAGTSFVDPGRGNVHTAYNPLQEVTILVATFFEVPATGPLTLTEGITPPDCDVAVGSHAH